MVYFDQQESSLLWDMKSLPPEGTLMQRGVLALNLRRRNSKPTPFGPIDMNKQRVEGAGSRATQTELASGLGQRASRHASKHPFDKTNKSTQSLSFGLSRFEFLPL